MKPNTPISELSFVGPKNEKRLKNIGIQNLRDLLFYFPRAYEDFSNPTPILQARENEKNVFKARVLSIKARRTPRRKMFITEAIIDDSTGALSVVWFNQLFVANQLKEGFVANFIGTVKRGPKGLVLSSPIFEIVSRNEDEGISKKDKIHSERIVPIYRESYGMTSRNLRFLIWSNLKNIKEIKDFLPEEIRKKYKFISLKQALFEIHFPKNFQNLEKSKKRLAFDELFIIRMYLERRRLLREKKDKSYKITFNEDLVKSFVKNLPFKLTEDQKKTAWQIIKDMEKPYPMERLLEGDVGSGKTIVAAIASLSVIHAGFQVAIMAPTEVLARQHFNQLSKDLRNIDVDLALLVGSDAMVSQKRKVSPKKIKKSLLLEKIKEGKIGLVIGTHALIQKNVSFKNLAFVVIDEQHRFGVEQRAVLLNNYEVRSTNDEKKDSNSLNPELQTSDFKLQTSMIHPHLLTMSATPIPRTLSLVFYGDLKISQIQKMPIGRKKIMTQVILPKERSLIYEFIRKEVAKGRQVFIICPLIEESEKLQVRAVEKEFERLSLETFSDLKVSLLHGRMKSPEKKQVMEDFQSKKTDILVSTPVIEVGIDIPNASIMMIEGAERFGLAQLHQLRGRVGRGPHQSYCFLLTDVPNKNNLSRLNLITHIENGFKLAEKDLQMRGPGDFIGYRQSGLPDLVMASLSDIELIKIAKEEAEKILEKDPDLEKYPLLQKKIKLLEEKIHLE